MSNKEYIFGNCTKNRGPPLDKSTRSFRLARVERIVVDIVIYVRYAY